MLYFIVGFICLIIGSFLGIMMTCMMAMSSRDSRLREKEKDDEQETGEETI